MKYNIIYMLLIPLLLSCQSSKSKNHEMISIYPLRPYSYTFEADDKAKNQILFFYTDLTEIPDTVQRKKLYDLVVAEKLRIKGEYKQISIYIYKKTDELNGSYDQDRTILRSAHKSDLMAYVRWTNESMDTFFITADNNVVYDVLEDKKASPPYEFE